MGKPIMEIQQGDEYLFPFVLYDDNGKIIAKEDVDKLRAKLGKFSASFPAPGKIQYSEGTWYFPLTQEMSYNLKSGEVDFQVQVTRGSDVFGSRVERVQVYSSILKKGG